MNFFRRKKRLEISKERADFLTEQFYELSFDDRLPDRKLFNTIQKPEELHFLADQHNWDDGVELLEWIIDSEFCDEATARLIFWRSQPEFYTEFIAEKEAGSFADVYLLLRKIVKNVESGVYKKRELEFNPLTDVGSPSDIHYRNPKEKWPIPDTMKLPVKGMDVVVR